MTDLVESITCRQCGGPLRLEPGDVIVTCPYCGTPARVGADKPFLLNHSMLFAKVDREGAQATVEGWMRGGFMMPAGMAREAKVQSLECVYVPFYVFEVDAKTSYAGVLTRTGTSERRTGVVPRDYFWKVLGRRSTDFPVRDYKIPLAAKVPFDTARMVKGSRFLNAEVDEDEAARIARGEVEARERELLKDLVDVVEQVQTQVALKDAEFLHAPLWFAGYAYKGKNAVVIIDAATGEVVRGDIPPPSGGFGEFLRRAGRDLMGG
jgi:hypothetical protein